ncbi:MAG: hypothetical protein HQK79_19085 [Desulfobacterales bacterium]|nr:hypothetical protein [Desulfobacterales bacterium]MBF0397029.1 hypothetical protein [Desulfobacterales bacterium]
MNSKQRIVVIITDILVLIELTISIYFANHNPEYVALEFFKIYIPLILVTLFISKRFIRKYQTEVTDLPQNINNLEII